jgi:hypothetical protein
VARCQADQIAADLVNRNFTRTRPNQLWVTVKGDGPLGAGA